MPEQNSPKPQSDAQRLLATLRHQQEAPRKISQSTKDRVLESIRAQKEKQSLRIHTDEEELEKLRDRLREQQRTFELKMQKEFEDRQAQFMRREESLKSRHVELEQKAIDSTKKFAELQANWEIEKAEREAKLQQANLLLDEEKERYNAENRVRLERTSKKYVEDALDSLQKQETKFHQVSMRWSLVGAGALIIGLGFFISITLSSVLVMPSPVSWEYIVFAVFKGFIAVTLLGALAKYSFLFSNSYVREALKNADRRHAINYGKFYLESYGAAADWSQIKEAFEHWNIGGTNAFSKPDKDQTKSIGLDKANLESDALEKAVAAIEQLGKIVANLKAKPSI